MSGSYKWSAPYRYSQRSFSIMETFEVLTEIFLCCPLVLASRDLALGNIIDFDCWWYWAVKWSSNVLKMHLNETKPRAGMCPCIHASWKHLDCLSGWDIAISFFLFLLFLTFCAHHVQLLCCEIYSTMLIYLIFHRRNVASRMHLSNLLKICLFCSLYLFFFIGCHPLLACYLCEWIKQVNTVKSLFTNAISGN